MDNNFCFSEKQVINKALRHVKTNTATTEEKLLVKLYNQRCLYDSLDKLFYSIQPIDRADKNIIKAFTELETSYRNVFNIIYNHCGKCDQYAIDILYEYLEDVLIHKYSHMDRTNIKQCPTRTFVLLDVIRNEMEYDKWYSMNDMITIVKTRYPEYDGILKKENMGLLVAACVQEGFFEEKREKFGRHGNRTKRRYFKKTNKEYLDLEEEKIINSMY